jgi:hypothetical protein
MRNLSFAFTDLTARSLRAPSLQLRTRSEMTYLWVRDNRLGSHDERKKLSVRPLLSLTSETFIFENIGLDKGEYENSWESLDIILQSVPITHRPFTLDKPFPTSVFQENFLIVSIIRPEHKPFEHLLTDYHHCRTVLRL